MTTKEELEVENSILNNCFNILNKEHKQDINLESKISSISTNNGSNGEDNKFNFKTSSDLEDNKPLKHLVAVSTKDKLKEDSLGKNNVHSLCNDLVYEIVQNLNNSNQKTNRIFTTTYVEKKKNQINFRVIKNREKEFNMNYNQLNSFNLEKVMKNGNDININNDLNNSSNLNGLIIKSEENNGELKINENEIGEQVTEICGPKMKINVMKDSYLDILLSKHQI